MEVWKFFEKYQNLFEKLQNLFEIFNCKRSSIFQGKLFEVFKSSWLRAIKEWVPLLLNREKNAKVSDTTKVE